MHTCDRNCCRRSPSSRWLGLPSLASTNVARSLLFLTARMCGNNRVQKAEHVHARHKESLIPTRGNPGYACILAWHVGMQDCRKAAHACN
jgi:hypothetical protein